MLRRACIYPKEERMRRWGWVAVVSALVLSWSFAGHAQRVARARIAPLPTSQWIAGDAEILGPLGRGEQTIDVFKTCLQHRTLCKAWMPFTRYVLSEENSLTRRDREILILRASWNCNADYDWAHHVPAAQRAGLSDGEILRVSKGADAAGWSRTDALLLRAADELHKDHFITDATWTALKAAKYSDQQLVDVIFTVGQYTMVSMFLNSAGVQLEPGFTGLPR
jgi:alkylhydroperoxidase family enzyme